MGAFLLLALLCWYTMSSEPVSFHSAELGIDVSFSFRTATLAVLGLLAGLTAVNFWRGSALERREGESERH